jgi:sarcosine oxidase
VTQLQADVVVVGAGINGVAAARSLARAGTRVILLEQYALGHGRGSSHGTSRIFRLSYPDPDYVRLAQQALAGWHDLEEEAGERLIEPIGSLDLGRIAHENAEALVACGVPHERLSGAEVSRRWPLRLDRDEPALFQADGGIIRSGRAHAIFVASAIEAGADVREHARASEIRLDGGQVRVSVGDDELVADRCPSSSTWSRRARRSRTSRFRERTRFLR